MYCKLLFGMCAGTKNGFGCILGIKVVSVRFLILWNAKSKSKIGLETLTANTSSRSDLVVFGDAGGISRFCDDSLLNGLFLRESTRPGTGVTPLLWYTYF